MADDAPARIIISQPQPFTEGNYVESNETRNNTDKEISVGDKINFERW